MESSYRDNHLAMKGRRFGPLDPGREVGALVNLLMDTPHKVSWQSRALAEKLLCLLRARRGNSTEFCFGKGCFDFELRSACFVFSKGIGNWLRIVGPEFSFGTSNTNNFWNKVAADIYPLLGENANYVQENSKKELFSIYLANSDDIKLQEAALQRFINDRTGVILVKDFSLKSSRFIADVYRRSGLSITESADGFGECWSL
jgi:hypothetical protein